MNAYSITIGPKAWAFGRWNIRSKTLWALGPIRFGLHRNLKGAYGQMS